jgi:hypothetical protein
VSEHLTGDQRAERGLDSAIESAKASSGSQQDPADFIPPPAPEAWLQLDLAEAWLDLAEARATIDRVRSWAREPIVSRSAEADYGHTSARHEVLEILGGA